MMEIISCQLRQPEATQKVIRETTSGIRKVFIKICDIYLEKRRVRPIDRNLSFCRDESETMAFL
jgi:hypothetical protein